MKRKRILHLLNSNKYSGAENVAITIIEHTHENYDAIYCSPVGDISDILASKSIPYLPIKQDKLSVLAIRKAIHLFQPDIIHAHDFRAGILSCLTGTHIPIINHLHNNSPWLKNYSFWTFAYAVACFRFNQILTVSDSVMDEFVFGKYFRRKTEVIGNPIDIKRIQRLADQSTLNDSSDIIFLGRLTPQKNPFFFLEIIKKIAEKKKNIKIAVVGDGELKTQFIQKIRECHLQNNIKMYGFQPNPYGLLKHSKVMCMPSLWEGFGLAAAEALTLGIPVVASNVGGLVNIVDDSCGKLCETIQEFIVEISKLLIDKNYYEVKSKAAAKNTCVYGNLDSYMEQIDKIYKKLEE